MREFVLLAEGGVKSRQKCSAIIRVYELRPPLPQRILDPCPSKLQPLAAHEHTLLVRAGHPDHDGRRIGEQTKFLVHLLWSQATKFLGGDIPVKDDGICAQLSPRMYRHAEPAKGGPHGSDVFVLEVLALPAQYGPDTR